MDSSAFPKIPEWCVVAVLWLAAIGSLATVAGFITVGVWILSK